MDEQMERGKTRDQIIAVVSLLTLIGTAQHDSAASAGRSSTDIAENAWRVASEWLRLADSCGVDVASLVMEQRS